MELLLNIVWVLLAVPAVWVWLHTPERGRGPWAKLSSMIVLSGILLLLFPVVSASDDLHAMRPEIEESSLSKKTLQHVCAQNPHSPGACNCTLFATHMAFAFPSQTEVWGQVTNLPIALPQLAALSSIGWRAPPASLLS